jgi:hypothetical protein
MAPQLSLEVAIETLGTVGPVNRFAASTLVTPFSAFVHQNTSNFGFVSLGNALAEPSPWPSQTLSTSCQRC